MFMLHDIVASKYFISGITKRIMRGYIMAEKSAVIDAAIESVIDDTTPAIEEGISSGATDVVAAIQSLNTPGAAFYSSIKGADFAARRKVASALTSSKPVDEYLGATLDLVNIIVMPVDLANAQGEINTAPRVILITADGTAYHATSVGLLSAVRNLFATLGEPDEWPEAVQVKVVEQKGRNGFKFFTINLV